ncbi:hypothetical protein B0T16DRAFT_187712 [Cercophora newfieldiana]|uniref:Uncharacterized protein n=1 Tax=Cercophora newfieldiana TaxID=92897 RepID=A0AA39Y0E4_9PEZI|nr:hypothetical protein B0T16DRAFT_187712 [Cercophora newfieldiana]
MKASPGGLGIGYGVRYHDMLFYSFEPDTDAFPLASVWHLVDAGDSSALVPFLALCSAIAHIDLSDTNNKTGTGLLFRIIGRFRSVASHRTGIW